MYVLFYFSHTCGEVFMAKANTAPRPDRGRARVLVPRVRTPSRPCALPRAHIMPVSDFIKIPCAVLRKDQPDGAKKSILVGQARSDKTTATGPAPPSGAPKSLRRLSEEERIKRYMDAAATEADKHHSGAAQCIRASTPVWTALMWIILKVGPMYAWLFRKAYWFYTWAPTNVLQMGFGLALCFFGGTFAAAIAAVGAWRQMGWQRSYRDAAIIYALDPVRHYPPPSPVIRPGIWRWLLLSFSYLLHLPYTSRICYLQVYGAGFSYLLLGETLGLQGAAGAGPVPTYLHLPYISPTSPIYLPHVFLIPRPCFSHISPISQAPASCYSP